MITQIYAETKFILRNDTAENWAKNNPVLALGEPGVVTEAKKGEGVLKIGDGITPWNQLKFIGE